MASSAQVAVATPSHRRAIRTKLLCFYAKHEPEKPIKDINDLCDWIIANGVDTFNTKLKAKYNDDLTSIKPSSVAELSLVTQLRLFYGEFDPSRPMSEVKKVEQWVQIHGIVALNEKMLEKYSENLNSLCFGGRDHLFDLLKAFFTRHDPAQATTENVTTIRDWTLYYGALKLNEKLLEKYGDTLHLSIEDIEKSVVSPVPTGRSRAVSELPTPAMWAEAITNRPKVTHNRISIGSVTSGMTSYVGTSTVAGAVDPMIDAIHLQRLVELFYARYAPQKLLEDIVDKVVEWTKRRGVAELNKKLRATYNTDLEDLENEYFALYDELELFYAKHEPKKLDVSGGLDDVVGWGLVHGIQPLSDRLASKYGEGLSKRASTDVAKLKTELKAFYAKFEPGKSSEEIDTIISWTLANSREALCSKMKQKFGVDLDDYKSKPAIVIKQDSTRTTPSSSTASEDGGAGNQSVIVTNELPAALGGTSNRLSNLGGATHRRASTVAKDAPVPAPQPLGTNQPATRTTRGSVVARPAGAPVIEAKPPAPPPAPAPAPLPTPSVTAATTADTSAAASAPASTITKTKSTSSGPESGSKNDESEDTMETEMGRMRQVVSGNYTDLGLKLEMFYKKHDPKKLQDKESLDLIVKWTLKHGINALNERLKEKWGENLNDITVAHEKKSDAPELPVF